MNIEHVVFTCKRDALLLPLCLEGLRKQGAGRVWLAVTPEEAALFSGIPDTVVLTMAGKRGNLTGRTVTSAMASIYKEILLLTGADAIVKTDTDTVVRSRMVMDAAAHQDMVGFANRTSYAGVYGCHYRLSAPVIARIVEELEEAPHKWTQPPSGEDLFFSYMTQCLGGRLTSLPPERLWFKHGLPNPEVFITEIETREVVSMPPISILISRHGAQAFQMAVDYMRLTLNTPLAQLQ